MWEKNPNRAMYGSNEIFVVHKNNAIEKLLLNECLFRNRNIYVRKKFVDLANVVKAKGDKVHIFSSL